MNSSNKKIITVLVAADNAPEAASLAGQIDRHDDLRVLATVMTPSELEEHLAQHPDLGLLVTDVVLSNKDVTPILAKAVQKNPKLEVIVEWFGVDFIVLCCLFVKEFGKALALGLVNCVMREFPDVHRSVFRAAMGAPKYQNVSLGSATLILCSPIRMPAVSSLSMVETLYICNTLMWRELHTIHPSELIHMVDGSKSVREV